MFPIDSEATGTSADQFAAEPPTQGKDATIVVEILAALGATNPSGLNVAVAKTAALGQPRFCGERKLIQG